MSTACWRCPTSHRRSTRSESCWRGRALRRRRSSTSCTMGIAAARSPPTRPAPGEPVVGKRLPNAFASTDLADRLHALKRPEILLVGFMTHMCVEATARAAIDNGLKATVIANATATRDLPDPVGGPAVPAAEVQRNALAALADRFATIVPDVAAVKD